MNEVIKFLKENKNVDFATVDQNNHPQVRPLEVLAQDDGKLIFVTSNKKKVYSELQQNPYVEFTVTAPNMVWIRVSGKAVFSNDRTIKQYILDHDEFLKGIYGTADHPEYALFYIENPTATFYSFTEAPKTVKM